MEPGILRFDVYQDVDDDHKFVLVEVYRDSDKAPAAHKETDHYKVWRDTVEEMMATPRVSKKFNAVYPILAEGWKYPEFEEPK